MLFLSIFSHIVAANPGLQIKANPQEISTSSDSSIIYSITIKNLDECDYSVCFIQIIKYIDINSIIKCNDCTYTFTTDLIDTPVYNGTDVTTALTVYIPPGKIMGQYVDHQIDVFTNEEMCDTNYNDCFPIAEYPDYPDEAHDLFSTLITGTSTPIPEFPTIALPIISVLGLVFLMSRRK